MPATNVNIARIVVDSLNRDLKMTPNVTTIVAAEPINVALMGTLVL